MSDTPPADLERLMDRISDAHRMLERVHETMRTSRDLLDDANKAATRAIKRLGRQTLAS